MRCNFFSPLIFFPACFAFAKAMAVNKHGHDSVDGLPVPITPLRDHHNERWPWHNGDSSQEKPGGWTERTEDAGFFFLKMKDVSWKHNINTTLTLWGNSYMLVGLRNRNVNVAAFLLGARYVTVPLPAGIFYFADGTCEILKDAGWEALSWCGLYMLWMR